MRQNSSSRCINYTRTFRYENSIDPSKTISALKIHIRRMRCNICKRSIELRCRTIVYKSYNIFIKQQKNSWNFKVYIYIYIDFIYKNCSVKKYKFFLFILSLFFYYIILNVCTIYKKYIEFKKNKSTKIILKKTY